MGWEHLIVPILAVAVWIIATVLRGSEQAKGGGRPGGRKSEKGTDLDRFLREVNRRRQSAERGEERPRRAEREEERPARAERRPAQSRAKWSTPPIKAEPIAVAVPIEVPPAPVVAIAPTMPTLEAAPLPTMPADASARSLPPPPESRALAGLRKLLRTREGLRQAMILQEVLGPPVSHRRRGR
jgi:hypothetical protein